MVELEFGDVGLKFVEGGKPKNPEKNPWSKARTNNKVMAPDRNRALATLVGGEHCHHYAIPAPSYCFVSIWDIHSPCALFH